MSNKAQYRTKQRDELLAFMESVAGQHITVNDVCEYFRQHGKTIGTTTVYHQLEKMVNEGLAAKYIIDGSTPACFEYVGERERIRDGASYHCKCEICGRLIHLHCEELPGIQQHILEHHGFAIDPMRTVFYGVCERCAGSE